MSEFFETENFDDYNHFELNITVSTKETDFSLDKMFALIANAIRGDNEDRYVTGSAPNSDQEVQVSDTRDGEKSGEAK